MANLDTKYNNKTIIFISNNLEIINYATNIIYIDGISTLTGTHNELLSKSENYRNLIKIKEDVI